MRTHIVLLLAMLIFIVGFFSSQVSLTGNYAKGDYYSSFTNEQLKNSNTDLTLDACRDVARFAAYNDKSHRLTRVTDTNPNPTILTSTQQNVFYPAFDLDKNGKVNAQDVTLCYTTIKNYDKVDATFHSSVNGLPACAENENQCRYGVLYTCTRDQYGHLSYAKVSTPNGGQKCHGSRIVEFVVGKQPRDQDFLFTAPSP